MQNLFPRAVCLLLSTIVLSLPTSGFSQEAETSSYQLPQGARYFLGEEDELLIRVNIWGFVRKPGQYMVPTDTDLISLMSFAGGPIEQAKISSIKVIRTNAAEQHTLGATSHSVGQVNQKYPNSFAGEERGNAPPKVIKVNVKKYLKSGDQGLIPSLMPGDTIVVEGTTFNTVKTVVDFMAKIAILGQLYFWLNR